MKNAFAVSALCLGLAAGPAGAFTLEDAGLTVGITPTISSDYLFRGISQTRNRPAAQVTVDIEHTSGVYVGAFLSNISFAGTDARQEVDVLAGYRFAIGGVKFDLGGVGYLYPGYDYPQGAFDLNYFELAARVSYEFDPLKVLGSAFWSPNFQAESGSSFYLEGGLEVKLPLDFTLAGRFGYQWIDRNNRFGTPDFANWNVTLSREVFGFTLTVGYYDTNLNRSECVGGQKICDARAMVTLSRTF
ncbi:TorF family putative porin [Muricoccus radiodurans]|uniref:TorF family putative porin n=1 Tax=Muricoccus radiodurans TaxID=2231721 RepID=UPI003CEE3E23